MAIQDIVECVGVEDVFYDSVDLLTTEDTSDVNEVWRNELRSVKERRDTFLSEMGFIDTTSVLSLRQMVESNESLSRSCSSSSTGREDENAEVSASDTSSDVNLVEDEEEHDQPIRHNTVMSDESEPSTSSGESLNKRVRHWWRTLSIKKKATSGKHEKFEMSRTKVHVNKKRVKELSALFEVQEIKAHEGIIWSMKFSPDGKYLASGGQDGVVRVWRVKSVESCCDRFPSESITVKKKVKIPVIIPDKMFQIEEQPVHEFYGHTDDVLDLAWSRSNYLLSSSTDKTVRLWHVGSDVCLSTFLHSDYVTCVQFNPVDDRYFISGSIDGKVRIWGVSTKRVFDWVDIRDAITAVCYQSDGHGFVLGSLNGACRFYETKGVDNVVELSAHIQIHSSKRSSSYKITGIQFLPEDSDRIMVMTEDSKLRIVDKEGLVCKYRGLPKSGGQMSASFSSTGRQIVSIGEDSSVYMWNHEDSFVSSPKHKKSNRSCEHFRSEGVSVALSWSGNKTEATSSNREPSHGFSFSSVFSSKSSAIWPEDVLPIFDVSQEGSEGVTDVTLSPAWGLVILTANCDGIIRTFHNYGLPVKV